MTIPNLNFGQGGGVVQLGHDRGNLMQSLLPLVLQLLERREARADQRAGTAVQAGVRRPGTTFGSLPADLQQAFQRVTGRRNISADEVLVPPSNLSEMLIANMDQIAPQGSILRESVMPTLLAQVATGQPAPLQGRGGHEAIASANIARAQTAQEDVRLTREAQTALAAGQPLSDAQAVAYRRTQGVAAGTALREEREGTVRAGAATAAGGAQRAVAAGREPTPEETLGYQALYNVVPGEVAAAQASASLRQQIVREATRILASPESSTLAGPLREIGVSVGDGVAAAALGVMPLLTESVQRRTAVIINAGQARNAVLEARLAAAREVAKNMGGGDPALIAEVMAGNLRAVNTPAGRAISAFVSAGFNAAIAERAAAGSPGLRALQAQVEFARTRLGQDEEALSTFGQSYRILLRDALARALLPGIEPGTDAYRLGIAEIERQFRGVLEYNSRGLLRPGRLESGVQRPATDQETVDQFRDAYNAVRSQGRSRTVGPEP